MQGISARPLFPAGSWPWLLRPQKGLEKTQQNEEVLVRSPWRLGFAGARDEAVPGPLPPMPVAATRPAPCGAAGNLVTAEQSATPDRRDILWHLESRLRSVLRCLPSSEGHTCPSLLWIAVTSHLLAPPACRSPRLRCAVVAAARCSLCLPIDRRPIHTRRSIMFL